MIEKKLPCLKTTQELLIIQSYLKEGQTALAVREGGRLLEEVLKDIYRTLFFHVPFQQRTEIQNVENAIGNGKKGFSHFTLGEMVRLFIEARFQKLWISLINREPTLFSGIDLGTIVANRNRCVHGSDGAKAPEINRCQAELSISMLKTFLVATGYVEDFVNAEKNFSRKDIQSLWRIKYPQTLVIITANSSRTPTGEYIRPATGIGQVRALAATVHSLTMAYTDINLKNIHLSTDHIQDRIENDIILLGGPKNNHVTRDFLDHLKNVQPADQHGSACIWRDHFGGNPSAEHDQEFYGQIDNEAVTSDYGLIIRCQNMFAVDDRTVILFSGSHTYGTMAAAKYFVERMPAEFPAEIKSGMNLSFLVKCKVRAEYPLNISVEKYFFWPRGNP